VRVRRLGAGIRVFAPGCAAAALGYAFANVWCFIIPPAIALAALVLRLAWPDGQAG